MIETKAKQTGSIDDNKKDDCVSANAVIKSLLVLNFFL